MDMELFASLLFEDDELIGDNYATEQGSANGSVTRLDTNDNYSYGNNNATITRDQVVEEVRSAPDKITAFQDTEISSLSNQEASGSGSSSPFPESSDSMSSDDDDDEEFDMVFLDTKRRLLKRVADVMYSDEVYDAANAKYPVHSATPPIWAEAKEVIATLTGMPVVARQVTFASNTKNSGQPKNKRARIDFSSVGRVDSKSYTQDPMTTPSDTGPDSKETSNKSPNDTKWMIKALQKLSETVGHESSYTKSTTSTLTADTANANDENWDIKVNPLLGAISVVPKVAGRPRLGATMADALAITDKPQLVCQASPPFLAVYANKAFFSYSRLTSKEVICKPVEEIITVNKEVEKFIAESAKAARNAVDMPARSAKVKDCQVQVKPVVNHLGVMSHVLVQVNQEQSLGETLLFGHSRTAVMAAHAHVLVGTVG